MEKNEKSHNDKLVNNDLVIDEVVSSLEVIAGQQNSQLEKIQDLTDSQFMLNEALHSLVESNGIRNKELNKFVSISEANNLSLGNIAEPNVVDWISASSNVILALLGAYAAVKVKSAFDDRQDNKVYAELEKFWEYSDDIIQDLNTYFLFFPFKLLEPAEEWEDNEDVKRKVESFLNFSESQSEKMKGFLHVIKDLDRSVNRLGWKIHPKAVNDFNSLYTSLEHIYRSFGEYNCMTAQLFRIDRQYIGMTMFMGVEDMEWEQRYALVDRNLPGHIKSINELKDQIMVHIEALETFSARKKFVSKR
ncbi:hypothetical protein HYO53_22310 [Vibrio parahaemolyticus]|nr:hypothetical protein [Vibrio parahaemolyticus]EGR3012933.1 hypothetical protein [Vibrio parahaemolyticus]EJB1760525.1 hypothetical protein [Vibrio parahaemolyticus]EJC6741199.1 hypothetical protein [Vibrio parahaemolyticus]EJC6836635.1 hypothetical protein [Vibrio parahaemolyticus]